MTGVLQALTIWIEIFKRSYLHVFCNNFAVTYRLQKTSIYGKVIQLLHRIAMLSSEQYIEIQANWILIKPNSLADIFLFGLYTKFVDMNPFIQIAKSIFRTCLKSDI